MKSKKIIAFLCAAAMTTSAFAGLTITASAADTTEFSDNFDSQTFGMIVDGTNTDTATEDTVVPGLKFVTTSRTGGDRGVYVDSNGDTVYTGSYYSIEEKSDSDNYLHLSLPMFGDFTVDNAKNRDGNGRYGHVDFIDSSKAPKTYTADATKDVVFDFDMKMNDGILKGVVEDQKPAVIRFGTFDSSAKTANAVVIDKAALSIGDEWVHARIVATNAGSKVYINGEEKTAAASNVKEFASIGLYTEATTTPPIDAKGDWLNADTPTKTPSIDIDNFVIYTTDAGTATATSTAPAATAQTPGGQIKPMPTPYVIPTAPTLVAPKAADADSVEVYRFDNDDTNAWYIQSDEQNITDISGLNIHFGGKTNGEASTFAQITKAKTGKVLQMQAGKFSHAGRGPLLSVNTSMPVSYADGVSTAMSMNVMLSAPKGMETGAAPRLYFLKSDSKAGEDKQGAYNQVAAVLTTDIDEKIYRSGEGSDVLSAFITPDEWHTVTLVITPTQNGATHRLFIDGAKDAAIKCDYVGSGDTASYMDNLPLLSPESKSASNDAAPDYSLVTIDNLLVYQGTNPEEPRSLVAGASSGEVTDPTPKPTAVPSHSVSITQAADNKQSVTVTSTDEANTAFDGVLVHASYNTSNTLKSVKTYDLKNIDKNGVTVAIPATDTVYKGDKLMVWNNLSGMVPYGTATAAGDAPVATYAVSVGSLTGGTITASPAADITAGTEVTLTVTPAEGKQLKEGTLKVMNGSEEVAVTNNKFQMPAANVTVTAEFEDIPAPVVTYTVVITADEHITDVKLGTKTGTKTDNTFTFTEVEAGEYTFNVTYENGYEKADASPTSITVSADKLTETISSKQSADPAITGTVTVTGDPVVGQTLTASVTGLNDGKTPVYAWQANTGAEGAYETIADATASTFVVPSNLVGKTIKAVVTAAGTSGSIASDPTAAVTAPTYTVSGTVDAGIATVALTPASGTAINGTITDTAVSFANVPAGEYTVTVTLKDGYKDAVVKLGTDAAAENKITVTDANITNLAVTSTKTISVSGTVDEGVATVKLHPATGEDLTGTINGTTVTFADVPAGTYTLVATTNNGYKTPVYKVGEETTATVTVADANITNIAVTTTKIAIPTLTGTVLDDKDFSDETDTWGFVTGKSGSVAVDNGILKLQSVLSGSKYTDVKTFGQVYTDSTDTEILFDFIPYINYNGNRESKLLLADKNDNIIFSIYQIGNGGVSFKAAADQAAVADGTKIANSGDSTSKFRIYLHLEKTGEGAGKVSGYVFDISGETPTFVAEIPETATTATGLGKLSAVGIYSFAPMAMDNVKITTHDLVIPVNVTAPAATDGTLSADSSYINPNGVITIKPTAVAGKKVSAVKVNGTAIELTDNEYKYTAKSTDEAIVVSAEFVRADVSAVTVTGAAMVQKGLTSQYEAAVKAGTADVTMASEIIWSVESAPVEDNETPTPVATGTTVNNGLLTVAADQETGNLVVKATVKKDVLSDSTEDTNKVVGTATVQIVAEPAYSITKSNATNGSFIIKSGDEEVALAKANEEISVVTTPATGYELDTITVTDADNDNVTVTDGKFTMPSKAVSVAVTFKLKAYTLTNSNATADASGNKLEVKVADGEYGAASTATMGQTVTVKPTIVGQDTIMVLTVTDTTANSGVAAAKQEDGTYTFTMPGGNVTISATFKVYTAIYTLNVGTSSDAAGYTAKNYAFVSGESAADSNVGDFGTGTEKTTPFTDLDAWGYIHGANGGNDAARQTAMGIVKNQNAVYVNGGGWNNVQPTASFILKNVDDLTLPTTGDIIFSFDAYAIDQGQGATDMIFGFTSANDGATMTSINNTTVTSVAVAKADRGKFDNGLCGKATMMFTYNVETGAYSISKDGTVVKSGTDANKSITGIYMQPTKAKYGTAAIANLVVKASDPVTP